MTDSMTKDWIRNASDERAAVAGYRFSMERAVFTRDWIQKYCMLYEGDCAGQPLMLHDWQLEEVMRLFGWVGHSADWGREIRRFRRAGVWLPKKSGKSPTLAAIGQYLFCGDGEQGQKIFSAARDGGQAMIAHQHALEMTRMSPELASECRINKSTGRITHEPSRSFYSVLHGDNISGQEGINGSILVDETHVVDWRLMKVLKGAGISRAEPLHLEHSTAGNNPDGYGKAQFDYGLRVESGEIEDHEFFFYAAYAPQDISDGDLDKNIMEIGKKANPAWGRMIKPTEFRNAYNTAKLSMSDLADFKMYRLNIWQKTSSPFLRAFDWQNCELAFTEEEMRGRHCIAGLDLSKTRDMTALSLVFDDGDDEYRVLPYFWLPEKIARDRAHLAPFMEWAKAGYLILTPGNVIDYGHVLGTFKRLASLFSIDELAYDPAFGEQITQMISEGVVDDAGKTIEEGTGVPRVIIPQTLPVMAPGVEELERAVIAGKLHHNGNPVLTWQAGHVQVGFGLNKRLKRLAKPDGKAGHRTIDGIAATVMALVRSMVAEPEHSYFRAGVQL